jgi:hypothetical protein
MSASAVRLAWGGYRRNGVGAAGSRARIRTPARDVLDDPRAGREVNLQLDAARNWSSAIGSCAPARDRGAVASWRSSLVTERASRRFDIRAPP